MRWVVALGLGGCAFSHGSIFDDAGNDAPDAVDAPSDGLPSVTCYDKWLDGTIRFDPPTLIPGVSSMVYDRDPFLPADELSMYFSTGRGGDGDVWVAKRPTITSAFSPPAEAAEFNSTSNDAKLTISADHTIAVLSSDRPGSAGFDVWEAIRASTNDPWPAMKRMNVMMVESAGGEHDPTISADGMHLYLAPDLPSPQHIAIATRGGDGKFDPPVTLTQLTSGNGDADPSPTPDERILVFGSGRPLVGAGNGDLWYTTRASSTAMFGAPLPIPDLNTIAIEGDPHLSNDGCRLYFARAIANYDFDLYVASAN